MSLTSPLEELGYPLFFPVESDDLDAPTPRLAQAQRTRVRSLSGMQKEALVTDSGTGTTWRLASDEGEYLDGDDVAPCPLAFMTAGMASSYANQVLALAEERGIEVADLDLVQDNLYSMTGSALRGDMTAGALSPELEFRIEADAADDDLDPLVADAVASAPVTGLLTGELGNVFSLALDGERLDPDRVPELDGKMLPDPEAAFESIPRTAGEQDPELGRHTGRTADEFPGDREKYTAGESSSLASEQDRVLHLRGTLSRRDDGLNAVEVTLYSPQGSIFELLSAGPGTAGEAPSPMAYTAAGVGFCFMTQFGRYADIVDKELSGYEVVQDTHFSADGAAGPGSADPIETHVFLRSPEGAEFARDVLDMSEQTCFLHALCRTDVEPNVTVTTA